MSDIKIKETVYSTSTGYIGISWNKVSWWKCGTNPINDLNLWRHWTLNDYFKRSDKGYDGIGQNHVTWFYRKYTVKISVTFHLHFHSVFAKPHRTHSISTQVWCMFTQVTKCPNSYRTSKPGTRMYIRQVLLLTISCNSTYLSLLHHQYTITG